VRHRLGLATRTQISVCKPFPSAGTAVSLFLLTTLDNFDIICIKQFHEESIKIFVTYSMGEPRVHIEEQEYIWSLRDEV